MSTVTEDGYTFIVSPAGVTITLDGGQRLVIDSTDLEDGGWIDEDHIPACQRDHCGDGDCEVEAHDIIELRETLKRWRDEESGHAGPFKFCDEAPCKAAGGLLGVRLG